MVEDFKKWAAMEEISWRQKSRELWLREGHKNTKLFHKMANATRRRNFLAKLRVDGKLLRTDEDNIKIGVANAFSRIFAKSRDWRPSISGLNFDSLPSVESETLKIPFSEEEVLAALSRLSGDKAPGPNGFTTAFWHFC